MSDEDPKLAEVPDSPVDASRSWQWHPVLSQLRESGRDEARALLEGSASGSKAEDQPQRAIESSGGGSPVEAPRGDSRPAFLRALLELDR